MKNALALKADADHPRHWNSYAVLEMVSRTRKNPSDSEAIARALRQLEQRGSASFSVQEHLTLLYMQRLGYAVEALLIRSWKSLTDEAWFAGADELPLLPKRVLARESLETVAFYEAAYYRGRQQPIFAKLTLGERWFSTVVSRITGSSWWTLDMGIFALLACALFMTSIGRQLLLGGIIGLVEASVIEYISHLGLCHASSQLALRYRDRLGRLGRFIEEINLAHKVHHFKMLTDFRADFSDEVTRQRVEKYLVLNAQAIVSGWVAAGYTPRENQEKEVARIVMEIRHAGYGVYGTRTGVLAENILGIPFYLLNFALFLHFGGSAFLVTSFVCLGSLVGLSMYSHRYLHMTDEDVERATEQGLTTALMRWYSRTPVARLQARRHYRHHHESFDYSKAVNGGVMSFSIADFLFKRGVQEADMTHLLKMRKEGFTNYAPRA